MPSGPWSDERFVPACRALHESGELRRRAEALRAMQRECHICPRRCGARRVDGEVGFCGASGDLEMASYGRHFGEEDGLVGRGGSGTIFLSHCNLRCVFCQNWEISQRDRGTRVSPGTLAGIMRRLQDQGCHNINLVTPTNYTAQIVEAIDLAAGRGLTLPIVWNTSGWERVETLRLLEGIVDVYMPDVKYADGAMAERYSSGARSYPEETRAALLEMHRQVGVAHPQADGIIRRGVIVRHLVMPGNVSGTRQAIQWIADNLPKDTYLNLMSQYRPAFRAFDYPEIARGLQRHEYEQAVRWAREAGLTNVDVQS
jgi:putative pyruvate formate lyase activating enzyme